MVLWMSIIDAEASGRYHAPTVFVSIECYLFFRHSYVFTSKFYVSALHPTSASYVHLHARLLWRLPIWIVGCVNEYHGVRSYCCRFRFTRWHHETNHTNSDVNPLRKTSTKTLLFVHYGDALEEIREIRNGDPELLLWSIEEGATEVCAFERLRDQEWLSLDHKVIVPCLTNWKTQIHRFRMCQIYNLIFIPTCRTDRDLSVGCQGHIFRISVRFDELRQFWQL